VTLGLGIGATVTVASFVVAVFFRPLAVPQGRRLVRIEAVDAKGLPHPVGVPAARLLEARTRVFDRVASQYSRAPLYVTAGGVTSELDGAVVSAGIFEMLGVVPRLGRFFTADEDAVPDRDAVAVVSDGLWHSRFGGAPDVLGRALTINGRSFRVVGVAPEGFDGVEPGGPPAEVYLPLMMLRTGYRWCDGFAPGCAATHVLARLAPGRSLEEARAEVAAMSRQLLALRDPDAHGERVEVSAATGAGPSGRASFAPVARLLSGAALLVMLVTCANVGGLLLARGAAREGEIALRVSLGAGRLRLVRHLLVESLLLATVGAFVGTLIAARLTPALLSFLEPDSEGYVNRLASPPPIELLSIAVVVSALAVAVFGLLPALRASQVDPARRIGREVSRSGAGARMALIGLQTALTLVLLVGAGLLWRSVSHLMGAERLDTPHAALLRLRPRLVGYEPARAQEFVAKAVRRLKELPGVEDIGVARGIGTVWGATGSVTVALPGEAARRPGTEPTVPYHEVSPRFFAALGVPLLAGRDFDENDRAGSPRVAIVNEALARRLWTASPLARPVLLAGHEFRVVGVVADYRPHNALESAPPMAYVPFWQSDFEPQVDARLAVRVTSDPAAALPALVKAIAEVDPSVPVTETLALHDQIAAAFLPVRLGSAVLAASSVLALLLSALGLYGVVAFLAARRTREVGVRMALGARPREVVSLFLRQGLAPVALGGAAGLLAAAGAARLLAALLFGVAPFDAGIFAGAAGAVAAIALLSVYAPALRASRLDPTVALRAE
jgi:predicted permease